jgi:Uncharacterized conserved protein (DUF2190)
VAGPSTGDLQLGFQTTTDLTRFRFVMLVSASTVKQADTAGARVIGVTYDAVTATERTRGNSGGKVALIIMEGIPLVEASAAISVGAQVATTNDGRAVTAATTNIPVGTALQASTAAGQWIAVRLTPGLPALP